jgi:predicted nucleotidyltransferase
VEIFSLNHVLIEKRLQERVALLSEDADVRKIVLFGSFATGRAVPGSDLDILIVLKKSDKKLIPRIEDYQEVFSDMGIAVDIFPYTEDELDNPVAKNALKDGKILYQV